MTKPAQFTRSKASIKYIPSEAPAVKRQLIKMQDILWNGKGCLAISQVVAAVLLMGLNAIAFAQAKPSAVKPAGAVLATPTPTPTPTPRGPGSAPGAQPAHQDTRSPGVPAAPSPSPGGTAINAKATTLAGDVSQMTTQQFRALPSTATLTYNGKSMTKAAFIDQRRKELRAHAKSLQTKANIKFKGAKTQFQQQQTLDLAARNARVKAVAEKYDLRMKQLTTSPAYSALAKEADGIVERYPSASSSEKAKLKQRAVEIHSQMQKMEQGAVAGR